MESNQIIKIIRESARVLHQDFDGLVMAEIDASPRSYDPDELTEFTRDLMEAGNRQRIVYLENELDANAFRSFASEAGIPLLAFEKDGNNDLLPVIFIRKRKKMTLMRLKVNEVEQLLFTERDFPDLYETEGKILFFGIFSYTSLVSEETDDGAAIKKLKPVQRLIKLLSEEKKDIFYIYVYAVLIGLISLTLPLGIQATVSFISGGVFFSSIYLLIGLVIVGVLAAGGLQVMQITLVEYLQRRVFTKAAFEFAFRVPRIKSEALLNYHAPELMNRFFDVLTIQKGLPKLLIDLSSGIIQIFFGLILLSLYHPFFVFFSILLVGILCLIFYLTGPTGLSSSLLESKYKYRVVHWLEELARTINSFKLSGNTSLPMKKTDYNVNNYLKNRKAHFGVLISQYSFILLFKALVTGGLLVLGTILVINREITLGQFVASEVIIILILNSVEKLIMYMDVVYDMLTAVDKIAHVTDLPLEKSGGLDIPKSFGQKPFDVFIKDLKYKFPDKSDYALQGINLRVRGGEHVCISGRGGSGKTVLSNSIAGLTGHFEGIITINGFSLRDLDLMNLRDKIGKNVSQEDIFEGSILENILLSKPNAKPSDAIWAIEKVGIADEINAMPDGLDTSMVSGGKGLPDTLVNKIILARCLAKRPNLLILNDFFNNFFRSERLKLIQMLTGEDSACTLIVVSNDPMIMAACDKVVLLDGGKIKSEGPFEELVKRGEFAEIID